MKKNIILFIFLLALFFYYQYDTDIIKKQVIDQQSKSSLFSIRFEDLTSINMEFLGENYRFEKKDGKWWIVDPVKTAADEFILKKVFKTLLDTRIERTILEGLEKKSTKEGMDEKWEETMDKYGLSIPDIIIDFDTGKQHETVYFGLPLPSLRNLYVRKGGSVIVISRQVREEILKNHRLQYWRRKKIIEIPKDDIKGFDLVLSDRQYSLGKDKKGDWMLLDPVIVKADEHIASGLIEYITDMKADKFYDSRPAELPEEELPLVIIRLITDNDNVEIMFYLVSGKLGFAKMNSRYFKVSSDLPFAFDISLFNLRDKRILRFVKEDIDRIDITFKEDSYSIVKKKDFFNHEAGWAVDGKAVSNQNLPYITLLLSKMFNLRAVSFPPAVHKPAPETYTAILKLFSKGETIASLIVLAETGEGYNVVNQDNKLYRISRNLVDIIPGKKDVTSKTPGE